MRKILSLLFVLIFAFLFLFVSHTPIYAACRYTLATDFIAPNSPIDIIVTGTSNSFFNVTIKDSDGNFSPGASGGIGTGETTTTITVISPATPGRYIIEVEEQVIDPGGGGFCDPRIATLEVSGSAPTVSDPNAPAELGAIVKVVENIIKLLVPAAAVAFFIVLIIGGIQFLMSGGDPKAAAGARNTLTYAIIGIILVVVSWLILLVVQNITGVDVTNVSFPISE
ncbi:hypothetical protein A3J17_01220 [Candidatus Curtissbacteria bacterium RIFCSPLOWO2_02_FULL_40_11]|uniref:Uncharacterized protein n=1 Tax=Candidatus Curtissbacteria bacterium RIFCSPHIGHO2_02_FULL_40_16b TaxID=1797714 RepID=A0A1F5GAU1_9BACT|nr:MAG: hypothetical protein A3D04_01370 [Candidatus Curtissbacteria bacterium RIFCSPHIGHO2_02_FULL_40_16b]OGD99414.1 MAG: hypothetical protein A3J17_01220 [Candidatus Curtissbacteria bacterium RIFCSPLOWO2_02_FULL_40_11]